jgi:hypothetical protein
MDIAHPYPLANFLNQVKGKQSSTVAKAKGKMGMAATVNT